MEKPQSELVSALRQAANGRSTIDLPTIWGCFYAVRSELKNDTRSRQRLASDLRAIAEGELISLPASKGSFDRTALPPLPKFVRLLGKPTRPGVTFDHRTFPWSLPMSFVAGLARLPNPTIVGRLNDFFRGDWASRVLVPVKERSYEIFGDEKALERVLSGQLGHEGHLTLEILRCYRVPLVPVHKVFIGAAPNVLIVENEATFDSVSRWNAGHRQFCMVIYGRGREVEKAADFLYGESQNQPGAIYYYGDVDRLGISIPYRLSQTLKRQGGREIKPATACYRLLLQQAPTTITMANENEESEDLLDSEWTAALNWLSDDLHLQAKTLLMADQRIAQEATGWELLQHEQSLV